MNIGRLKWKIARLRARHRLQPKRLWVRYLIGLATIFFLILVSHASSLYIIKVGMRDAELIKLSSQQNVLSQQILTAASRHFAQENYGNLKSLLSEFTETHNILLNSAEGSEKLTHLYWGTSNNKAEGLTYGLHADSMIFVEKINLIISLEPTDQRAIDANNFANNFARFKLTEKLGQAVLVFEQVERENLHELDDVQRITFLASVIVLLFEFLFIFLPAQKGVVRAISRLERHKKSLRQTRERLAAQNQALTASFERMEHAALHDPLTQLPNRRYLERELSDRLAEYANEDGQMVLMHIDLDNFKIVNDTLGHKVGDYLLEHAADLFRKYARRTDFIARIGGDEFVILTDNNMNRASATMLAERLVYAFSKAVMFDETELKISASIGIDIFEPQDKIGKDCVSEILTHADVALYLAKENGRNTFEFFDNDHYQKFIREVALK